jgi:hypothetical protein
MAGGRRPGGLTALAVLNFVFGGLGALGLLAIIALLKVANDAANELSGGEAGIGDVVPAYLIYLGIGLGLLKVILLITSGVGYIGLKKFLGRTLGNVYALVSLTDTAIAIFALHTGFGVGTIIGLIYPVLTLILLNTTFKEDFVN